jgi:citrate lyase subunit beta/citryl-CoA lyase
MSVSEKHTLNANGIMVDAPVLRRAERIVQLVPHPGN